MIIMLSTFVTVVAFVFKLVTKEPPVVRAALCIYSGVLLRSHLLPS